MNFYAHTFRWLCECYGVREADRKRMLGHSFGSDFTNGVNDNIVRCGSGLRGGDSSD